MSEPAPLDGLDGLRGGVPAAMARAEVVATFDEMAPRFDALLVDTLEYRVPERLRALIDRVVPGRSGAALDLGCGTGLAGAQLRPRVDVLDGVDLSPRMLEEAARRGVYDHLHEGDVVEHLLATAVRYDLIVATDVFIYVGDLAPLFEAARAALAGGGHLAASVERHDGVDVRLAPTGRYQHSRGYLERLAAEHDLEVLACEASEARLEGRVFVPGWLFVLAAGRGRPAARARPRR